MQIAAFDIIEISDTLDTILSVEPTEPINENFETVGFESIYLLNNMGTLAIAYLIWFLVAIVAIVLKLFLTCHRKIRKVYHRLQKKLFYNSLI